MVFVQIDGTKITGIFCGPSIPDDGLYYEEVPPDFAGCVGQDVGEFTPTWDLRPLADRLADNLIPNAERFKAVGEELVPKIPEELVRDGIENAPQGLKLDPNSPHDAPRFITMTPEERVAAGELSEAAFSKIKLAEEEARLLAYLAETDAFASRALDYLISGGTSGAEMPDGMLAERQAARDRISAIRSELAA